MSSTAIEPVSPNTLSPSFARQGLSSAEAERRRAQGLGNDMPVKSSRPITAILRENVFSLTNLILFGIMIALVLVGKAEDAFVTGGVVLLNVALGVFQEIRAKRQLDRIALLTRPRATVIRDGEERAIDPSAVVAGDAVLVRPGDQIVVDGTLLTDSRIDVDESLLTGESDHVPKERGAPVLSGSFCVSGSGVYLAEWC